MTTAAAPAFQHQHAAHCESGVISSLLKPLGINLSEPMVFGLSGAMSFAYLPFLRFGNMPLVSYRMLPGHIVKNLPKRLGVKYFRKRYRRPEEAMADLDRFLGEGRLVGIQTSAYFTPYFPPRMRFQFNAHNSIVMGKEGDEYLISDPVFEEIQRIKAEDLSKARFARGLVAPKGLAHFPLVAPPTLDLEALIRKAIRKTVNMMLHAPPLIGLKGMRSLARKILKLSVNGDATYTRHFLGNIVRMQEEIGTGGGGFRFIYAAFLQEARGHLGEPVLMTASEQMTAAGDAWRLFALACAKAVKQKSEAPDLPTIANLLIDCAKAEEETYRTLKGLKKR